MTAESGVDSYSGSRPTNRGDPFRDPDKWEPRWNLDANDIEEFAEQLWEVLLPLIEEWFRISTSPVSTDFSKREETISSDLFTLIHSKNTFSITLKEDVILESTQKRKIKYNIEIYDIQQRKGEYSKLEAKFGGDFFLKVILFDSEEDKELNLSDEQIFITQIKIASFNQAGDKAKYSSLEETLSLRELEDIQQDCINNNMKISSFNITLRNIQNIQKQNKGSIGRRLDFWVDDIYDPADIYKKDDELTILEKISQAFRMMRTTSENRAFFLFFSKNMKTDSPYIFATFANDIINWRRSWITEEEKQRDSFDGFTGEISIKANCYYFPFIEFLAKIANYQLVTDPGPRKREDILDAVKDITPKEIRITVVKIY